MQDKQLSPDLVGNPQHRSTSMCTQEPALMTAKNLLVYDNFQVTGGAEYVTKVMLEELSFDKVLVNYAQPDVLKQLSIAQDQITTIGNPTGSAPLSMLSSAYNFWKYQDNQQYDTAIISGIFAPLITPNIKAKKIIYYCHTPPRFLYDLKDHYKNSLSPIHGLLLGAFSVVYKRLYENAFQYIDTVLANSKNVQSRLSHYLGVDSEVVYPPCDTSYEGKESKGYFLSTARLEPYKRVDMIVEAFMQMPEKQLIVMSGGSLLDALKEKASNHPNITFTGWVEESQKRELIARCEATIYIPKDEDFGMSPVESISAGKAVIGVDEGGMRETVKHEQNGFLCNSEDIEKQLILYSDLVSRKKDFQIINSQISFNRESFVEKMESLLKK